MGVSGLPIVHSGNNSKSDGATGLACECTSQPGPAGCQGPHDRDEDARADEGDDDAADEPVFADDEGPEQETADKGTTQSDGDVADQTVPAALHHLSCQETGNQAHDQ